MKRSFRIATLIIFTLATVYAGCRKDDSTLDTNKLPGVVIDTTGMGSLSVYQFNNLVVKPKIIHEGIDEKDLAYSWRLTMSSTDTTSVELGTERNLNATIRFNPQNPGSEQRLILTVFDTKHDLKYYQKWLLTIYNNIGMGLVIAETDGNGNGDLSHIMSPEVTLDYSGESVKHKVYSSLNNQFISGKIKRVAFKKFIDGNAVLALTDNSVTRVSTLTYLRAGYNANLFFAPVTVNTVQNIYEAYQIDALVVNNQVYAIWTSINKKWGTPLDNNFKFPEILAVNGNSSNPPNDSYDPIHDVNFYSEDLGAFVYVTGMTQFDDKTPYRAPVQAGQAFNANDLPNKVNLAAGITVDKGFLHILKDKTTGAVGFYLFNGGSEDANGKRAPLPLNYFDLSSMPGIQQATLFEILDDQRVFYYASGNKIYAVMYGGANPIVEERYTAPAGEQITTMNVYRHPGYPLLENYISTNNKLLIVSTYNTEGKVHFIPMKNPGLGTLDIANIKTFTGFGKVTAVGPQL
jgi:hypothetical protein